MRIIYLDDDYRCFTQPGEGRREVETEEFDGRTEEDINRFRYIPDGESWRRGDGVVFHGIMVAPAKDDVPEIEDMRAALALLGVTDDE